MKFELIIILVVLLASSVVVFAGPHPPTAPPHPSILPCTLTNGGVEICDGLDNDCNVLIDDGLTAPLTSLQSGVCSGAVQVCGGFAGWLDDYSTISNYESFEGTCDSLDNDCDGILDEGCACQPGDTAICGPSNESGVCVFGTLSCVDYAWSDTCVGAVLPSDEMCNGLDDDCDGSVDENLENVTYCGLGACVNNFGIQTCSAGAWSDTSVCDPLFGASSETCDNVDNDCDGEVDEGGVCDVPTHHSSHGGSSSSNFVIPTSVETNESLDDNGSYEGLNTTNNSLLNKTIVVSWDYQDNVASMALPDADVHFKRFHGLLPERNFVNESKITFVDNLSYNAENDFLKDNYFIFEQALFDDAYADTKFEELFVTFSMDEDWLLEHNVTSDDVNLLYKNGGAWSLATTDYLPESSVYQSRVPNSGLEEFLLVADIPKPEIFENASGEPELIQVEKPAFSFKDLFSTYILYIIIFLVVLGAAITTFVLARHHYFEKSDDDSSVSSVSSPVQEATASGAHPSSLEKEQMTTPVQPATSTQPATPAGVLKQKNIPINERVIDFIHKKKSAGATVDEVKNQLRKAHWPEEYIEAHIAYYDQKLAEGKFSPSSSSPTTSYHQESFTNQHK